MSNHILVVMYPECIASARNDVFGLASRMAGVMYVTDLDMIDRDDLDKLLAPRPGPAVKPKTRVDLKIVAAQSDRRRPDPEPAAPVVAKKRSLRERIEA